VTRGELIAALQEAPRGSVELDGAIYYEIMQPAWESDPPPPGAVEQFKRSSPHRYTQSLDAALQLVPQGYVCRITIGTIDYETGVVSSATAGASLESAQEVQGAVARAPALAVCIVALQAR
jgi:hypothetical protein